MPELTRSLTDQPTSVVVTVHDGGYTTYSHGRGADWVDAGWLTVTDIEDRVIAVYAPRTWRSVEFNWRDQS